MDRYTKFILTMIAVGIFLNLFATKEIFGINSALADYVYGDGPGDSVVVYIKNWPNCN